MSTTPLLLRDVPRSATLHSLTLLDFKLEAGPRIAFFDFLNDKIISKGSNKVR